MLRKVTLGLLAAASLTIAAAAPAAAGPFHHHHHWGHHWGHGFGIGGIYLNTGYAYDTCLQQQWVETRRGLRLRTVNVCAY